MREASFIWDDVVELRGFVDLDNFVDLESFVNSEKSNRPAKKLD